MRQCYRCFGFDHTKNYCTKEPRCGRCSMPHLTGSSHCSAKTYDDLVCVNCHGKHEATHKGCRIYVQRLKSRKTGINISPINREGYSRPTRTSKEQIIPTSIERQGLSYADASRPGQQRTGLDRKNSQQHLSSTPNTSNRTTQDTDYNHRRVENSNHLQHSNQTTIDGSLAQVIISMQQTIVGLQKTITELLEEIRELRGSKTLIQHK